jgi:tetratricopeptide (TPR) repeat protein
MKRPEFPIVFALAAAALASASRAAAPATRPAESPPSAGAPAAPSGWHDDCAAALAAAREAPKGVLMYFGSTEAGAAADALAASLADPRFCQAMTNRFVLLRFECRPDVRQPEQMLAARDLWADRLHLEQFPALVLLDSAGRPTATCTLPADPSAASMIAAVEAQEQHLEQRDRFFAAAQVEAGVDRARSLHAGLLEVPPYDQNILYLSVMEQIVAADADGSAGLRQQYWPAVSQAHVDAAIQQEIYPLIDQAKYAAALARLSAVVDRESPPRPQKQLLLAFEAQLYQQMGNRAAALSKLNESISLDTASEQAAKVRAIRDQLEAARPKADGGGDDGTPGATGPR